VYVRHGPLANGAVPESWDDSMKRWLFRVLFVIALGVALMLAAGLAASWMVAGAGKDSLAAALSGRLGVTVSVTAGHFDLGQWFRFKPAISLEGVAVSNPPGFPAKHLLSARRFSAQVELLPLFRRIVRVRSITIDGPRIVVERNVSGKTNLETVLAALSSKREAGARPAAGPGDSGATLAIDELRITSGEILLAETAGPKAGDSTVVDGVELRILDFQPDGVGRLELEARLFRGRTSRLKLVGRAGPFAPDSLPVEAAVSVTVAPGEIPAPLRQEQFGKLLGAPGEKGKASLQATVKGDAYRTLSGAGRLALSDILAGKDARHVLGLSGDAPLTVSCARLMSDPNFRVKMADARLRLGEGEWNGAGELEVRGTLVRGSSKGSLRSIEVNQMLSSLTGANEKMFGVLEAPAYSIQFAGRNAEEIRDSLSGSTRLSITKGRIAALDLLASIRRALEGSQQETPGAEGSTPFSSFVADLQVGQRKLDLSGIVLDSPALSLTGNGSIGFDGTLGFDLEAAVSGELGAMVTRVVRSSPGSESKLPLVLTGTLDSPKVRPNVRALAGRGARGLVESFLKKRAK
jgi:hypothetical protein